MASDTPVARSRRIEQREHDRRHNGYAAKSTRAIRAWHLAGNAGARRDVIEQLRSDANAHDGDSFMPREFIAALRAAADLLEVHDG